MIKRNNNMGHFSVDMSPLNLIKNLGDMYMHNSDVLKTEVEQLFDGPSEEEPNEFSINQKPKYPLKIFSNQPNNRVKNSFYYNYVNKNGQFMNIHEKIGGDDYVQTDIPDISGVHKPDFYEQKQKIDKIINLISRNEQLLSRNVPPKTYRTKQQKLELTEEEEGEGNRKQLFPSISLNGLKSKWRIAKELEETRLKQEIKDRNTYHTTKKRLISPKTHKKGKVMKAMGGPYN
jgi:hypothetical protein